MSKADEYEQELNNLWGKLKRNCDGVGGREILKEKYPGAYKRLRLQIRDTKKKFILGR